MCEQNAYCKCHEARKEIKSKKSEDFRLFLIRKIKKKKNSGSSKDNILNQESMRSEHHILSGFLETCLVDMGWNSPVMHTSSQEEGLYFDDAKCMVRALVVNEPSVVMLEGRSRKIIGV